jgi:outer membrane protein OmpA-like peptidoglycan-associated protein
MDTAHLRRVMLALGLVGLTGCAARARPPELVAFEKLQADPTLSDADRRAFDLLAAADDLLVRVEGEWERHDAAGVRRDAIMGQIKMKTALAILEAEHQRSRIANFDAALALAQDEQSRLDEQLATAREAVALIERFRSAKQSAEDERKTLSVQIEITRKQAAAERQRLTDQITAEKLRAQALDGVRSAELAVRTAETVDTPRFAKARYTAAAALLQNAHKAFDAGHWEEVLSQAALCRTEAEAGASLARPQYERATESTNALARDRALEADATALPGVKTRLERDADLQRLVLALGDLFAENTAVVVPHGAATLDAIEGLLSSYPSYAVQITGVADEAGKPADAALALARANAVFWALVNRGIDSRRLRVDSTRGRAAGGDDAPAAKQEHHLHVELAILYHIAK